MKHLGYYVISDVKCGKYIRAFEPLEGELAEITEKVDSTQLTKNTETKSTNTIITEKETTYKIEEKEKEKVKEEEKIEENDIKEKEKEIVIEEKEIIKEIEKEKEKQIEKEKETEKEIVKEIEKEKEIEKKKETEITKETIKSTEISQTNISLFNCSNLVKCSLCDEESFSKNLCIKCNNQLGYYYLNINPNALIRDKYIDCVNNETKPPNFFSIKRIKIMKCVIQLVPLVTILEHSKKIIALNAMKKFTPNFARKIILQILL